MLIPIILTDTEIEKLEQESTDTIEPSKTFKFDFESGELFNEFVDNEEAIKQSAIKAIITNRDKYLIYSEDYGCEIFYLLGKAYSEEYLKIEVPRLIDEALMSDDRIESVDNFIITKVEDVLNITFDIITNISDTNITVEVVM